MWAAPVDPTTLPELPPPVEFSTPPVVPVEQPKTPPETAPDSEPILEAYPLPPIAAELFTHAKDADTDVRANVDVEPSHEALQAGLLTLEKQP